MDKESHVDLGLPLTILTSGLASSTNPNPTGHPGPGSPGRCEWAPCLRGLNRTSAKNVRVLVQAQTGRITEGADISTYTTDDAVPFRVQPIYTDAHSRHDWCRMNKASPCLGLLARKNVR